MVEEFLSACVSIKGVTEAVASGFPSSTLLPFFFFGFPS